MPHTQAGMSFTHRLLPKTDLPPLGVAASVALAILAHCQKAVITPAKKTADAMPAPPTVFDMAKFHQNAVGNGDVLPLFAELFITDDQFELLEMFNDEIALLRLEQTGGRAKVATTLVVCPVCDGWLPFEGGSKTGMKCVLRYGCVGKMIRVTAAAKDALTAELREELGLPEPARVTKRAPSRKRATPQDQDALIDFGSAA